MSFSVLTKLQILICLVFVFSLKISAQKEVEKFGNVSLEALKSYTGTWEEINNTLLERSDFGKGLDNYKLFESENIFLPDDPPAGQIVLKKI